MIYKIDLDGEKNKTIPEFQNFINEIIERNFEKWKKEQIKKEENQKEKNRKRRF